MLEQPLLIIRYAVGFLERKLHEKYKNLLNSLLN